MTMSEHVIQIYYQRLVDHHLIFHSQLEATRATDSPSTLYPRCPICSNPLASCNVCAIVTCQNDQCAASKLIPAMKCCHWHKKETICEPCILLSKDRQSGPLLDQCPHCGYWFCFNIMNKCMGRPAASPELAKIHAPKSISCPAGFAAHAQSTVGLAKGVFGGRVLFAMIALDPKTMVQLALAEGTGYVASVLRRKFCDTVQDARRFIVSMAANTSRHARSVKK
ncbi:hypothetical protein K503DRAFT_482036 [Rhizopogon vinicolor AM-OR11-026]|uniref:Uncharacterized protein n=1 Tax=Rhizopogon vinicolor AM-OR11-026 TaxID=1314800 RepID=A0A1B7N9P5_9AGAM|nr:hypothetical protein K503DRAFT_482036 [Rhizopogon vinicolor AM-OR11-026]